MHILIAPNSFKNSLDATSAAEAIKQGLLQSKLACTCECFPIGDGGDGTGELLIKKFNGKVITAEVHDPLQRKINACFGLIDEGRTAVVEMANATGIKLLKQEELNPLHANSFGTGELIKQTLDAGVKKITLCIGGSATVDGGTGILQALGFKFLSNKEHDLTDIPAMLVDLLSINTTNVDQRIFDCEIIILCDVDNYLLGDNGAAKIFGSQKGANKKDIEKLEAALTQLRNVTLHATGKNMNMIKHGAAAGGVAAGLSVWLNAGLVNGIEYFLDETNFNHSLQKANMLFTAEGSIDAQTLQGKAPFGVAKRAKEKNIPVIGFAGKIPKNIDEEMTAYFDVLLSINNETDIGNALLYTKENLIKTAKAFGDGIDLYLK